MTQTTPRRAADRAPAPRRRLRIHRAWSVAAVAFVALVGAAGFRATPSVLIDPLHDEFGWSHSTIGSAVSVNMVLYGLTSPFAAALMERFGMRRVVAAALALVAAGSGLAVLVDSPWQLVLCWGVLVGLGTGSMALAFVATVTNRWFAKHNGLVTGVLTAGGAAGQLVFLPLLAWLVGHHGWRTAALTVSGCALVVVPLVALLLQESPEEAGTTAYGAEAADAFPEPVPDAPSEETASATPGGPALRALRILHEAAGTRAFWLLAGTFAICGASTNGLVGTHFVPAAHDHGMPETTAAGLLAVIGVFDLVGTVASGWFTDRFDARALLGIYYVLRGVSLMFLPMLFADSVHPSMLFFIIFYGLDWVATVPPTVALCRKHFGADGSVVFGWVFASHQVGAGLVALLAGMVRDAFGTYDLAWYCSGALCTVAASMALVIRAPAAPAEGAAAAG